MKNSARYSSDRKYTKKAETFKSKRKKEIILQIINNRD